MRFFKYCIKNFINIQNNFYYSLSPMGQDTNKI